MMASDQPLPPLAMRHGAGSESVRLFESVKRNAVTEMGGVLSGFWGSVEEQVRLAALAGHDYGANQDDRLAITALQHRALELATRYREAIEREFDRWLDPKPAPAPTKSLSLMTEDELEIQLAGQQTTELLDHQFLHPLEMLDERLQALANALGVQGKRPNPMRPDAAVRAFTGLFGPDDLTPGLRLLVFRLHDKRLPHALGAIYERTNLALEHAGYGGLALGSAKPRYVQQAGAPAAARAPAHGGNDGELWVPDGGVVEHARPEADTHGTVGHAAVQPASSGGARAPVSRGGASRVAMDHAQDLAGKPPRYRDVVRAQLHSWRERLADAAEQAARIAADAPQDEGHVLATEELLSVAQSLQKGDAERFARALAGDDSRSLAGVIREALLDGSRQLGLNPDEIAFSIDEEDAIDLIGLLFQSLIEANDLLARARELYGRLVLPYLKVALVDDSMFNRRSHPARQLLDALTEACDGNSGETSQDRETLDCAENAVQRVVSEFDEDQAIFELAATELRDQLDQQRRRSDLAEKRAAESIHGRERLQHARLAADDIVASRLSERTLTRAVADFLNDQWRHHLVQTWLRDGPESQRHRAAIAIGDAMVQVDNDAMHARGGVVADQLLALQVPLAECYSSCGLEAAAARDAMARIIAALGLPDTTRGVHVPQAGVLEPDLSEDDARPAPLRLVGGTDTLAFDAGIAARMRRLRVGQGLRLIDDDGHESAARVAWISPLTARMLIVNRRGMRRLVVSPEELAVLVASGHAVVRAVDAPFDEAMKQLWQQLNQTPTVAAAHA